MRKKNRVDFLMNANSPNLDSFVRVDHAGEFAAVKIYEAQEKFFDSAISSEFRSMKEQELNHLKFFENLLSSMKIRPTVFLPLWSILASALGNVSACLGVKYAMLCTVAVEDVIDRHYRKQIHLSGDCEFSHKLESFRLEEVEHMESAMDFCNADSLFSKIFLFVVKFGCITAISLSERI